MVANGCSSLMAHGGSIGFRRLSVTGLPIPALGFPSPASPPPPPVVGEAAAAAVSALRPSRLRSDSMDTPRALITSSERGAATEEPISHGGRELVRDSEAPLTPDAPGLVSGLISAAGAVIAGAGWLTASFAAGLTAFEVLTSSDDSDVVPRRPPMATVGCCVTEGTTQSNESEPLDAAASFVVFVAAVAAVARLLIIIATALSSNISSWMSPECALEWSRLEGSHSPTDSRC